MLLSIQSDVGELQSTLHASACAVLILAICRTFRESDSDVKSEVHCSWLCSDEVPMCLGRLAAHGASRTWRLIDYRII
jgi:hypothetical protein